MALITDTRTPGTLFSTAELNFDVTFGTAMGLYRMIDRCESHLDFLVGARAWTVYSKLDLGQGELVGITADERRTWVDPVVGIKGNQMLYKDISLKGWALIGGFHAASKFMWDLFLAIDYKVNSHVSTSIGWRHVGVDYQKNSFLFDLDIDGPMADLTIIF